MKYGYARVSTAQQKKDGNSLEEQCNQLRQEGCDFIVEEQFTGARMDRPKFQRLCSLLEKGDTLVVCKLDRFARTVVEGAATCRELMRRGVRIHILNMGVIEDTPVGRLILTTFLTFLTLFLTLLFSFGVIIFRSSKRKKHRKQRKNLQKRKTV